MTAEDATVVTADASQASSAMRTAAAADPHPAADLYSAADPHPAADTELGARRLLLIPAALLVVRAVEAVVAAATVGALTLLPLDEPAARIDIGRMGKVEAYPHTATTALVTVAIAAVLTVVLLRSRWLVAQFVSITAFALVAGMAIAGAFASGPVPVKVAVAAIGAFIVIVMWPQVRGVLPRALEKAGARHVDGRVADVLLIAKISLLVAVIVLIG
jgi:hypothetical protein